MRSWTGPERRSRDALFAAMIPGHDGVDLAPFWDELDGAAPLLLRIGLRAIVWALTLLPPLVIGAPRLFTGLDAEQKERFFAQASKSPLYPVRQMVLTLKTLACMAYLRDPSVRRIVEPSPWM